MRRCCRCCPRRHTDGGTGRLARGSGQQSRVLVETRSSASPYLLPIPRRLVELNTPARAAPRLLAALGRAAAPACRSGWTAALALNCSLLACCSGLVGQTGQQRLLASLQFACWLLWSCRADRAAALACRSWGGAAGVRRELLLHCSALAGCFGLVGQTGQLRSLAAVG